MSTFSYLDISVDFDVVGSAYDKVQNESGRNPEYWDTGESRRFRELLNLTTIYDEDKLRRLAVSFRKKPEGDGGWVDYKKKNNINGKKGGNGRGKEKLKHSKISPKLQAHYDSLDYAEKKDACRERDEVCRLCGCDIEEFHHATLNYDSVIGTPGELKILTGVCEDCHPFADAARKNKQRVLKQRSRPSALR